MLAEYGAEVADYDEIAKARLLLAYTRRQKFNARLIVGQLAEALGGSTGGEGSRPERVSDGYRQVDPATLFAMMGVRAD